MKEKFEMVQEMTLEEIDRNKMWWKAMDALESLIDFLVSPRQTS